MVYLPLDNIFEQYHHLIQRRYITLYNLTGLVLQEFSNQLLQIVWKLW